MPDAIIRVGGRDIPVIQQGGFGPTGLSAKQIAIAMGEIAAGATDEDFFNWLVSQYPLTVTGASGQAVTTVALLEAVAGPVDGQSALLMEGERFGWFKFDDSDLTAPVAADTLQGIYVAPASDATGASGAWVRQVTGPVRPEWWGAARDGATDDTLALRASCSYADSFTGEVELTSGTYRYSSYIEVAVGVNVRGTRDAILKPIDQGTATLTATFTSGTGAKTVSVDDTSAFVPGRNAIVVSTTANTVSPNDAFNHRGRQVASRTTSSGPGDVVLAAGPNMLAGAVGDILALSTMGLVCLGDNLLTGFTVDGNEASHTYGHWITSTAVIQEGDGCTRRGIKIQNTPSDAILAAGTSVEISGSWDDCIELENIGGNGIHWGLIRDCFVKGCRGNLGNVRWALPVEEAGGNSVRLGHQDGFVCLSNDVANVEVTGNIADNWICGVAAIGTDTTTPQENDDVLVSCNTFIDCAAPIEVILHSKRVKFKGNKCRAQYPYQTGTHRWDSQTVYFVGSQPQGFIQNIEIEGNEVKNGLIMVDRVKGGHVRGNIIDNRELSADAATLLTKAYGIAIFSSNSLIVSENETRGGYVSLWLQNSFATADALCRDIIISDNLFLNPFLRGVSGTLGGTGTMDVEFRGNVIRGRLADTLEDDTTALTFNVAGGWRGLTIIEGMVVEQNRIEFDITGGAAVDAVHAATAANRHRNKVNGVLELPVNAADDTAAAAANIAVGGQYRNGSDLMVRAA